MPPILNIAAVLAAAIAWIALDLGGHLHATTHAFGHGGGLPATQGGPTEIAAL